MADARKPRIFVIGVGGTIAGVAPSPISTSTYRAGALGVKDIFPLGLQDLAELEPFQLMNVGSKNLRDPDMVKIARAVCEATRRADVDGVVVTHGTDTMEDTSYLSHLLVKTEKPIVFVGSMRPSNSLSADGPLNLFDAVRVAACHEAANRGVLICMNGVVLSARDAIKNSTYRADAFVSQWGPVGAATEFGVSFYRSVSRLHTSSSEFDVGLMSELPPVAIVASHGDLRNEDIISVADRGARGIVFAGTGDANFADALHPGLRYAHEKGVTLVRASRVLTGPIGRRVAPHQTELGMMVVDDQPPQKARILLAVGLAFGLNDHDLQRAFYKY